MKTKVAVFAEELLKHVKTFTSKEQAKAYIEGWEAGGYTYGAGDCYGVLLTPCWEKDAIKEGIISENNIKQIKDYISTYE